MKTKKLKKILSIGISSMMMIGLFTVTASAADLGDPANPTLKIKRDNATYTAYKMLDAEKKEGTNVYEYSIAPTAKAFFENNDITVDNIKGMDEDELKTLAEKFNDYVATVNADADDTNNVQGTTVRGNTEVNIGAGYYVVNQTASESSNPWVQNQPIVVAIPQTISTTEFDYSVEINPKDEKPSVDKSIVENGDKDSNDVAIGSYVTYKLTADVPLYPSDVDKNSIKFYLTDTLSEGLTFDTTDAQINITGDIRPGSSVSSTIDNVNCTVTTDKATPMEGGKIKFDFTGNYNVLKDYSKIYITYRVKLNDKAKVGGEANPNDVNLTYSNSSNTENTFTTEDVTVKTYTYGLAIKKVNAENPSEILPGAKFGIYLDKECKDEVKKGTTGEDGYVSFKGLDEGTYYIKELAAPNGYILSQDVIKVVIESVKNSKGEPTGDSIYKLDYPGEENDTEFKIVRNEGGSFIVKDANDFEIDASGKVFTDGTADLGLLVIGNKQGFNLPTTGGAGTWMFTIGGLVLMAGAVVVFISSRKKAK